MSAFPKFDPIAYLEEHGAAAAKAANRANPPQSLAALATLAGPPDQSQESPNVITLADRVRHAARAAGMPTEDAYIAKVIFMARCGASEVSDE